MSVGLSLKVGIIMISSTTICGLYFKKKKGWQHIVWEYVKKTWIMGEKYLCCVSNHVMITGFLMLELLLES